MSLKETIVKLTNNLVQQDIKLDVYCKLRKISMSADSVLILVY